MFRRSCTITACCCLLLFFWKGLVSGLWFRRIDRRRRTIIRMIVSFGFRINVMAAIVWERLESIRFSLTLALSCRRRRRRCGTIVIRGDLLLLLLLRLTASWNGHQRYSTPIFGMERAFLQCFLNQSLYFYHDGILFLLGLTLRQTFVNKLLETIG